MNSADIVKALGRKPDSSLDKWLKSFMASPGETATLTTTECYRLYTKWCETMKEPLLRPEAFAHEMKLLGYGKKVKYIRTVKRDVYKLNEPAALKLLAWHRADPTPPSYRMPWDMRWFIENGLTFKGMQSNSKLSPYPPEWFQGKSWK